MLRQVAFDHRPQRIRRERHLPTGVAVLSGEPFVDEHGYRHDKKVLWAVSPANWPLDLWEHHAADLVREVGQEPGWRDAFVAAHLDIVDVLEAAEHLPHIPWPPSW